MELMGIDSYYGTILLVELFNAKGILSTEDDVVIELVPLAMVNNREALVARGCDD